MTDDRLTAAYRAVRADGTAARHALAIARRGLAAIDAGVEYPDPRTFPIMGDDGRPYTAEIDYDPEPQWAWDDDVHGEVIDRYRHPDYIGGEYGGDRADGETVLALDRATAYRVDKAAESVSALAEWRHRQGMARGPAYEAARSELLDAGRRMMRDEATVYYVTVTDADGRTASVHGVEVYEDTRGERLAAVAYLYDVADDLAAEVAAERQAERDAVAAALPRMRDLWLFAGEVAS